MQQISFRFLAGIYTNSVVDADLKALMTSHDFIIWIGLGALRQSVLAYYVHAPDDQMPLLMSLRQTLSKAVSSVGSEDGGEVWGRPPRASRGGNRPKISKDDKDVDHLVPSKCQIGGVHWCWQLATDLKINDNSKNDDINQSNK